MAQTIMNSCMLHPDGFKYHCPILNSALKSLSCSFNALDDETQIQSTSDHDNEEIIENSRKALQSSVCLGNDDFKTGRDQKKSHRQMIAYTLTKHKIWHLLELGVLANHNRKLSFLLQMPGIFNDIHNNISRIILLASYYGNNTCVTGILLHYNSGIVRSNQERASKSNDVNRVSDFTYGNIIGSNALLDQASVITKYLSNSEEEIECNSLVIACLFGHNELITYFCEIGMRITFDIIKVCLYMECKNKICLSLLNHKLSTETNGEKGNFMNNSHTASLNKVHLPESISKRSLLDLCSQSGHSQLAKTLLKHNLVDDKSYAPLRTAVIFNHAKLTNILGGMHPQIVRCFETLSFYVRKWLLLIKQRRQQQEK